MNALINNPNDSSFRLFVSKIPSTVFDSIASNLVAKQVQTFGKCVKFDFNNLESVVIALGLLEDTHALNNVVDYYIFDAKDCDLNLTDYSDASADFKDFLDKCVLYIADYFANAGSLSSYQKFIRDINWTLEKETNKTLLFTSDLDVLEFVLFDLITYAYLLQRLTKYYLECEIDGDLDADLVVSVGSDATRKVFYIPAIKHLALEYNLVTNR